MDKLRAAMRYETNGEPAQPPLRIPRALPGLASRKVLVMEFVHGTPLSKLAEEAKRRGVDPNSPEAQYLGTKIVTSLGDAYARMIFGGGFTHGDPHPGNIFIDPSTLDVALIDCGQTKQLSLADRIQFRDVVVALQRFRDEPDDSSRAKALAGEIRKFGVTLRPREDRRGSIDDDDACLVAVALLLFGDKTLRELPGGYDLDELSPNSPFRRLASFPQSLVRRRASFFSRSLSFDQPCPGSRRPRRRPHQGYRGQTERALLALRRLGSGRTPGRPYRRHAPALGEGAKPRRRPAFALRPKNPSPRNRVDCGQAPWCR